MVENIQKVAQEIEAAQLGSAAELEQFRITYIGRKGAIAALFDDLKSVAPEQRRQVGQELNQLKNRAQARFDEAQEQLTNASAGAEAENTFDFTLPPIPNTLGTRHPLSLVRAEIVRIFERIGFNVSDGPEIEDDWHNFTALNFPENHPAREMQDTFFLSEDRDKLLRTHTSNVQVRLMENNQPPLRSIMPGRVYRNEAISARAHMVFQQVEGLYVNKGV